jgi:hypothetical protein
MSKIKEIMDQVGKDILTEDTKKAITDTFDGAVNDLVTERVKIEVTSALEKLDEDHSQKLKNLLATIDEDHTKKLKDIVQKIDENHAKKLTLVVEKYETMLKEEADEFRKSMVNEISNYLDLYVEKTIPKEQISEAVENVAARKMVEKIKKIVSVDDEYVTKTISEAVEDGKNTIEQLRQDLNEAMKENIKINHDKKVISAQYLLEKKTANLPDKKKAYVVKLLGEKAPEEIEQNFSYVVEMFERDEKDQVKTAGDKAKSSAVSKTVDTPKSVITESKTEKLSDSTSEYLSVLKEQDGVK